MRPEAPEELKNRLRWLGRSIDVMVLNKATLLGSAQAGSALGLEESTVKAVLDAAKVRKEKQELRVEAVERGYASPKRFKIYQATRENPQAGPTEISRITGISNSYVRDVMRILKACK
jgi:predicted transcriptional regulator